MARKISTEPSEYDQEVKSLRKRLSHILSLDSPLNMTKLTLEMEVGLGTLLRFMKGKNSPSIPVFYKIKNWVTEKEKQGGKESNNSFE